MTNLSRAFRDLVSRNVKIQSVLCKVISVNETELTCDVEPTNGDAEYLGVRLKAVIDEADVTGVYAIPKVGSHVIISIINNDDSYSYVSVFGTVEKYIIECLNGAKIEFKNDGKIVLNGGALGGLIKIEALVDRISRLEEKMNSHTHSGGNISGNTGPVLVPIAPLTIRGYLENEKVTHG